MECVGYFMDSQCHDCRWAYKTDVFVVDSQGEITIRCEKYAEPQKPRGTRRAPKCKYFEPEGE